MTTIAALLFGSHSSREALERALTIVTGPAQSFSVAGLSVPTDDVAAALAATLEIPVGTLALQGWGHHRQVVAARERTRFETDSRETIRLKEHTITSTQRPALIVDVNGVASPLLELTLAVAMHLNWATLVVERGEITSTEAGQANGSVALKAGTMTLAKRDFSQADVTTPGG